jgi:hypothetical protein
MALSFYIYKAITTPNPITITAAANNIFKTVFLINSSASLPLTESFSFNILSPTKKSHWYRKIAVAFIGHIELLLTQVYRVVVKPTQLPLPLLHHHQCIKQQHL